MNQTLVKCSCCGGTGKAALTRVLQRTLDAMPIGKVVSTQEVFDLVRDGYAKQTAISNRLRSLEKFGVVKIAEERGRILFWKRVK